MSKLHQFCDEIPTSRPTSPVNIGLILAVVVSVYSGALTTSTDWILGPQRNSLSDPHEIPVFDGLAKRVLSRLPQTKALGFISNQPIENFYKFQYGLGPILLVSNATVDPVLGYFPSTQPVKVQELAAKSGLRVEADLGGGVFVLRHIPQ